MLKLKINQRNLAHGFRRLINNVANSCYKHGTQAAAQLLETSNRLCPYETGRLRNSGTLQFGYSGFRPNGIGWVRGANSSGGGRVELFEHLIGPPGGTRLDYLKWRIFYYRTAPWKGGRFKLHVFIHENLQYKPQHPGTQAKFLETATMRHRPDVLNAFRRGLREGILKSNKK